MPASTPKTKLLLLPSQMQAVHSSTFELPWSWKIGNTLHEALDHLAILPSLPLPLLLIPFTPCQHPIHSLASLSPVINHFHIHLENWFHILPSVPQNTVHLHQNRLRCFLKCRFLGFMYNSESEYLVGLCYKAETNIPL